MAYTIDTYYETEIKVKGSKFIAVIFPVDRVEDAMNRLNDVRTHHPKATHHCWAYKVGCPVTGYRMSDDGEPSGTAGRPILGQINSNQLTDILIIVVRYFGGVLLGTSGLITAYKAAAAEAIAASDIIDCIIESTYTVTFGYEQMNGV
ncbi:MAG TPA: YigZ family protein, partial [Saprospiraceae bacterium]|nr:YigZ family protein [Saprospiraceae bacterium]